MLIKNQIGNTLPHQEGHAGEKLMTDGSMPYWDRVQNTPIRAGFHYYGIPLSVNNNNDGTVTIASAACDFYNDSLSEIRHYVIAETIVTLSQNTTNHIYADRATLTYGATTNGELTDDISLVRLGIIYPVQVGPNYYLHTQLSPTLGYIGPELRGHRQFHTNRYARESGFDQMSVASNLNITGNGGTMWSGDIQYAITDISSASTTHAFTHDASGNWQVSVSAGPKINNMQYDPATGVQTLAQNKNWTITYIYRGIENEDHIYTTLSPVQYDSDILAKAGTQIHIPPDLISAHAVLIARVLAQKGLTTGFIVQLVSTSPIYGAALPVNNHNDLAALDGGIAGQYFHLTSLEYTGTGSGVFTRASSPQLSGTPTVDGGLAFSYTASAGGQIATTNLVSAADLHLVTGVYKTLVLDTQVYDDMIGGSTGIQVQGAGVSINTTEQLLEFTAAAALNDFGWLSFQLSHKWKKGTDIHPHLHWEQNQNQIPNFLMRYRWQSLGGAKVTGWTDYFCRTLAFTYVSGTLNNICSGLPVTPPAGYNISDIIQFRIFRDTANASGLFPGADTFTGTVGIQSMDFHYAIDTQGSRQEFIK